jgi:predicted secreted hydrolase
MTARRLVAFVAVAALVSGCTNGGVLRAAEPTVVPTATPTVAPSPPADPVRLAFPRDEGPHRRLTEWWYYTGHLTPTQTTAGATHDIGFEFVIFRAERGDFPVGWASHFAVTDAAAGTFRYAQRTEFGTQVDRSPAGGGFDLSITGTQTVAGLPNPGAGSPGASTAPGSPWTMRGVGGHDHLHASAEPGTIDVDLTTGRPPALHGGDGWIDLGIAGGTYYYSRTRLDVSGMFAPGGPGGGGGTATPVSGIAWFDHQWGDFIAVGAGGWDWFSVQLEDGRDLTLSLVHGPNGEHVLDYGTLVAADGSARHLDKTAFAVTILDRWKSPHSGGDYPAEWRIELPAEGLTIHLVPTLADQELDTRASSGNFYWEGEVSVDAIGRGGQPLKGVGYVELTGYAG